MDTDACNITDILKELWCSNHVNLSRIAEVTHNKFRYLLSKQGVMALNNLANHPKCSPSPSLIKSFIFFAPYNLIIQ